MSRLMSGLVNAGTSTSVWSPTLTPRLRSVASKACTTDSFSKSVSPDSRLLLCSADRAAICSSFSRDVSFSCARVSFGSSAADESARVVSAVWTFIGSRAHTTESTSAGRPPLTSHWLLTVSMYVDLRYLRSPSAPGGTRNFVGWTGHDSTFVSCSSALQHRKERH